MVKKLNVDIRALHQDLTRLNDLVSKNEELQKVLANDNYAMETEFINELKEMEQESIGLDGKIKTLKENLKRVQKEDLKPAIDMMASKKEKNEDVKQIYK